MAGEIFKSAMFGVNLMEMFVFWSVSRQTLPSTQLQLQVNHFPLTSFRGNVYKARIGSKIYKTTHFPQNDILNSSTVESKIANKKTDACPLPMLDYVE